MQLCETGVTSVNVCMFNQVVMYAGEHYLELFLIQFEDCNRENLTGLFLEFKIFNDLSNLFPNLWRDLQHSTYSMSYRLYKALDQNNFIEIRIVGR